MPYSAVPMSGTRIQDVHQNVGPGVQNNNCGPGTQYIAHNINIGSRDDSRFLKDLFKTDPKDDKQTIESLKGDLIPGLCHWIVDHPSFRNWRTGPQRRLLWITGEPGKGKTMLMCHTINYLRGQGHKPLYYFCQATRKTTATDVVRGLLWLLLTEDRSLIEPLRHDYEQKGEMLFQDSNSLGVLCAILTRILSDSPGVKVTIVVDALDECETDLDRLLGLLMTLSKIARTIVSSRDLPRIANGLSVAKDKLRIVLGNNKDKVDEYIRYKVNQLATLRGYDQETYNKVSNYLRLQANGTFLWVSLVCEQLADNEVSAADTYSILSSYPKGLDEVYQRILDQISGMRSERKHLCFKTISLFGICCNSISSEGLSTIFGPSCSLEQITKECRGLLIFQNNAIYLVHQSVKEFWFRKSTTNSVFGDVESQHTWLLSRLIQTMSKDLRGKDDKVAISFRANTPMSLLQYACVYWIDHFIKSNIERQEQQDIVYHFLETHFLHWVEALSRLRLLFKGIDGLVELLEACKSKSEEFVNLIWDALRFLRRFRVGIERSPIEVYRSALLFSPEQSAVRKLFADKDSPALQLTAMAQRDWGSSLQSLEAQSPSTLPVVFSSDGSTIVSAFINQYIALWKTDTGSYIRSLRGHSTPIHSLTYSKDGSTIVSGSASGTITLWDTAKGHFRNVFFTGHKAAVVVVALDERGQILVSGSLDRTIKIWDAMTGTCRHTLEDVEGARLAVSGDGKFFAFPTTAGDIQLWNAQTFVHDKTLRGQLDEVQVIALSGNGRKAASASNKYMVVWDLANGSIQSRRRVDKRISAIVFSTDNSGLATNWGAHGVKLWKLNGHGLKTLHGFSGPFHSLCFSPDGRTLASSATDGTVKLWDVANDEWIQSRRASVSTPSPDDISESSGLRFRSDSSARRASLWRQMLLSSFGRPESITWLGLDRRSYRIHIRDHHFKQIAAVAFSPDGKEVVVVDGNVVTVWDYQAGWRREEFVSRLDCASDAIVSTTFCKDSIYVAEYSSSDMRTSLWDIPSGRCLKTVDDGISVTSLAFSRNGSTLAAYGRVSLRLWDTATGDLKASFTTDLESLNPGRIRFSENGSHIYFDSNSFNLSSPGPIVANGLIGIIYIVPHQYRIRRDLDWIAKGDTNVLWLPPGYRPSVWDIVGSDVVMGCGSRVVFIRLPDKDV
ncbi:Vegetative incompatibility protein HET-E-1 [Colletotrichum gloeosporioides]|uniref:Vegetative incompatibility protein HET-E-1 n=1 Tax=Colletotrichum gloeosporioides TaxID=474922 RepID=A0A8H4FHU5_COLGL|nr:Vegetative incompatibility protein HET-E-1 [Colletotrichum gloeosporioides]KAF3802625.1 Vegetative incompatibility protein HET-E-1 [Colletotrichum gloeosporioides]